jgi:hypothetical protein
MTTEIDEQPALDGMPVSQVVEQPQLTLQISGPADAAFKTTRWGLEQVREHLANARADRLRINEFIAMLVKQEKYLTRMARIADDFDKDDEEAPPTEE